MNITVECIHRANDLQGSISDYVVCDIDDMLSESYKITCHINSISTDNHFYLPVKIIVLNDVLGLSANMPVFKQYDCRIEISSFKQVNLYTNHIYSIRGIYRSRIPQNYYTQYKSYKDFVCIELANVIILISLYNNIFDNTLPDGDLIEVIPQNNLNLRSLI